MCVCLFVLAITKKSMPKGNNTDYTKHLGHSIAEHSTHFCFTRNLSASLGEVTHQYTPLIQDIHDTVSWYHWCHMIICDINVHRTYVDLQFCLCGLCTYVCMYVCLSCRKLHEKSRKLHKAKAPWTYIMILSQSSIFASNAVLMVWFVQPQLQLSVIQSTGKNN